MGDPLTTALRVGNLGRLKLGNLFQNPDLLVRLLGGPFTGFLPTEDGRSVLKRLTGPDDLDCLWNAAGADCTNLCLGTLLFCELTYRGGSCAATATGDLLGDL